jgi:RNA polymerase sigma factor (sigma-70 family)
LDEGFRAIKEDYSREREQERKRDNAQARAAQAGDMTARDDLYLRYRRAIRRATEPARRLAAQLEQAGSHVEPDDLEGEGFIIFCDLLAKWQPERAPFVPYMLAAMSRRAYHYVRDANHVRSTRRAVRLIEGSSENEDEEADAPERAGEGQDVAVTSEQRERWEDLAGRLSADWRRLVEMRYGRDLPVGRVALVVGCSERTVNRAVEAALELLREVLALDAEVR